MHQAKVTFLNDYYLVFPINQMLTAPKTVKEKKKLLDKL